MLDEFLMRSSCLEFLKIRKSLFSLQLADGVSFLLFSAETLFDDMEFLAVAEVMFCDPINEFTYSWSIQDFNSDSIDLSKITGNVLKLPPKTFKAGQSVVLIAKLLNKDSLVMAQVRL